MANSLDERIRNDVARLEEPEMGFSVTGFQPRSYPPAVPSRTGLDTDNPIVHATTEDDGE